MSLKRGDLVLRREYHPRGDRPFVVLSSASDETVRVTSREISWQHPVSDLIKVGEVAPDDVDALEVAIRLIEEDYGSTEVARWLT